MNIKIIAASALALVVSGCSTFPSEYNGVTFNEIKERTDQLSYTKGSGRPCDWVSRQIGRTVLDPLGNISKAWEKCLLEMAAFEAYNDKKVAEQLAKREKEEARHQEIVKAERAETLRKRKQYGPTLLDLATIAYMRSTKEANELLEKYNHKVNLHSGGWVFTGCNSTYCTIGTYPGGEFKEINILTKGVWDEPGASVQKYKVKRIESLGYGLYASVVFVLTR